MTGPYLRSKKNRPGTRSNCARDCHEELLTMCLGLFAAAGTTLNQAATTLLDCSLGIGIILTRVSIRMDRPMGQMKA